MTKFLNFFTGIIKYIKEHKKYATAVVVFIAMILLMAFCTNDSSKGGSALGITDKYKECDDPEITSLIQNYYYAYANDDIDTLKSCAYPISDQEASYIDFYSQCIESYNDIVVYTKKGLDNDSLLASVYVKIKFVGVDTPAPGLDFFYLQKNSDGKYYINNIYSSFNQANAEYEMDPEITALIAEFEQQSDVIELQAKVQKEYNEALMNDETLNTFVNVYLKSAAVEWASNYKATVAYLAEQEEEQKAAEAEEAKKAEEAAAEESSAFYGTSLDKINIRASADKTSEKLGTLAKGEQVKIYSQEGEWYKIECEAGTDGKGYVMAQYIEVTDASAEADTEENATADDDSKADADDKDSKTDDDADDADDNTTGAALNKGDVITLSKSVKMRKGMGTDYDVVCSVHAGDKVTVVMSYAEGWTKVTYYNKQGYIRTDLLQ